MVAQELMQADAPTLSPDDDLPTAAELLTHYDNSVVAVVDDAGRLVGLVTDANILGLALPAAAEGVGGLSYLPKCYGLRGLDSDQLREVRVRDIMRTENLVSVDADELAAQAALLMIRHGLQQLPVVAGGRVVGRICRKAIINEMVNPTLGVACNP